MRLALLPLLLAPLAHADTLFCRASLTTGADDGSSWADAFRGPLALQSALARARPGDQIWLAQGVYKPAAPGGPRTATFTLISGVRIYGGFTGAETSPDQRTPGLTSTLSADLNGNGNRSPFAADNAARLAFGLNLDPDTLLDSLIFTGALANISGEVNRNLGAGLLLLGGAPTVRNCTFRDNASDWVGGGAAAVDGAPVFEDCTFDANHARAGHNLASQGDAATSVRRCRFTGDCRVTGGSAGVGILSGPILPNQTDHPALLVEDSFFSIAENPFACPSGMGVYASQGTVDVRRTDFIDNKSCGEGVIAGDAAVTIDRCRFIGNEGSADGGAAIHTFDGDITVANSLFHANDRDGFSTILVGGAFRAVNCTFSSNGSTGGIGGGGFHQVILTQGPGASLENCIFWGNVSRGGVQAAVNQSSNPPRFDRCLVQGWTGSLPGAGSFDADPRFADPDGPDDAPGTIDDDLRLQPGSPALDRANSAALASTLDLDGMPRFRDDPDAPDLGLGTPPFADLGCYERQPPCPADFNHDGFVDFFDYNAFVAAFESADPAADVNHDAFLDFFDYDTFVAAFETGC